MHTTNQAAGPIIISHSASGKLSSAQCSNWFTPKYPVCGMSYAGSPNHHTRPSRSVGVCQTAVFSQFTHSPRMIKAPTPIEQALGSTATTPKSAPSQSSIECLAIPPAPVTAHIASSHCSTDDARLVGGPGSGDRRRTPRTDGWSHRGMSPFRQRYRTEPYKGRADCPTTLSRNHRSASRLRFWSAASTRCRAGCRSRSLSIAASFLRRGPRSREPTCTVRAASTRALRPTIRCGF